MGSLCRRLGLPRSTGQIYGLLYFSVRPLSLDEIAVQLGVSKASASTGTRQLSAWGAIHQTWVPGERRDFFEVVPDLGGLFRNVYRDFVKPRLSASQSRFSQMLDLLATDLQSGAVTRREFDVCSERIKALQRVQKRLTAVAPLVEKLL